MTALGPFKLKLAHGHGAGVELSEVLHTADGRGTEQGNTRPLRAAFPRDDQSQQQFVNPGETMKSSLVYAVDSGTPRLLGWFVCLNVASMGIIRHGLHWADRTFVPLPADSLSADQAGGHNDAEEEPPDH